MDLNALDGGGAIDKIISEQVLPAFFHVNHFEITNSKHQNLMHASRLDPQARFMLNELSNNGYYLYMAVDGISRFVKHERLKDIWQNIVTGQYQFTNDGIVYQYEPPLDGVAKRLVVVFSSMGDKPFETSLNRYFVRNFSSLTKYVPPGTGILRIGDLGSAKGAFYLNTKFLNSNEQKITNFIDNFISDKKIPREQVVLFGPSKGGTGSLFNSLQHGWNVVAVDPLTSDEIYVNKHADAHFVTGGVFLRDKNDVFHEAVENARTRKDGDMWQRVIITSNASPQKSLTMNHLLPINNFFTILDSNNPRITGHVNVSANTLWAQSLAINNILTGFFMKKGNVQIP